MPVSVAPHEFRPLGRIRHRKKCRHCYLGPALHPYHGWVPARPLGDKSDGILPALPVAEEDTPA
jgi:hypothetical protein